MMNLFLQNTLQKNDLNVIKVFKNIKKTLKKSKSNNKVRKIINLVRITQELWWIDSIFFMYNVKMRKNQRPFTGTEINVKLS